MNRRQYYAARRLYRERGRLITIPGNPYADRLADCTPDRQFYEHPGWKFLTASEWQLFDVTCKPVPKEIGYRWLTTPVCRTQKNKQLGFYRAWKLAPHLVACRAYAKQMEQQRYSERHQ